MNVKRLFWCVLALGVLGVLAVVGYVGFGPSWIDPVAWTPDPNPGWAGVFAPDASRDVEFLTTEVGLGPEDVAMGPDGLLYTGLRDGRIMRLRPDGSGLEEFVGTGGIPLGLQFDAAGDLIVADGHRGLVRVTPDRNVVVLVHSVEGIPIQFADDLDIGSDGTIWFSDMTTRLADDLHIAWWEGRATGRLLAFDPATGTTTVWADSLHFPNGVALGPGERYVLVNELVRARVVRVWVRGPRAGARDLFLTDLPSCVDNVSYDPEGFFWVALVSSRNARFERYARWPFIRSAMTRIPWVDIPHPNLFRTTGRHDGCVIAVDTTGVVRASVHDPAGKYGSITSVNRFGDGLFLGSIGLTAIARVARADVLAGPGNWQ